MRKMFGRALLVSLIAVPGGLLMLALYAAQRALATVKQADPKWNPSLRVLLWARAWCLVYRVPFPLSLAVLHNEVASTPRALKSAEQDALAPYDDSETGTAYGYPVGDIGIPKGPSFGAGQVLRVNVARLWAACPAWLAPLVKAPDMAHLNYVGYERAAMWLHVKVLREYFDVSNGDLHETARRYNGSGEAAETYADRADTFQSQLPT